MQFNLSASLCPDLSTFESRKVKGFSDQNTHQVVEHHLVKGQHVAALGYGTLGGDQLKTNELLARA